MEAAIRDKIVIFTIACGSLFLLANKPRAETEYAYSDFINPEAVSGIASSLPPDLPGFIIGAWQWVSDHIAYDNFGTVLYFSGDGIDCDNCLLPSWVIASGESNCVGKSSVLTSILRNRLPPDQVYMVVGTLTMNGAGGHAWVRVQYEGVWYVLESTIAPPANPWMPEIAYAWKYIPDGWVNDQYFQCLQQSLCVAVHSSRCNHY